MSQKTSDATAGQIIYLVEDDDAMRSSLSYLLTQAGYVVQSFSTPHSFLASYSGELCSCMIVDLEMPGMSGLQLAKELSERRLAFPFIVLTGYGTIATAVEAMRLGACDFLEKPVEHSRLLDVVEKAVAKGRASAKSGDTNLRIDLPNGLLTVREHEIMMLVIDGKLTKQIAGKLNISPKTVDVHRSHIMKKLEVTSVAQLVRKVLSLND